MKPTPSTRPARALAAALLAAATVLIPSCGHTREAVYPGRKVAPARLARPRPFGPRSRRPAPSATPPAVVRPVEPTPPTIIDVPGLDRNAP